QGGGAVAAQLRAPVGELGHLAPQLLDRDRQLGAVGLDRGPDLGGRALGHQASSASARAATASSCPPGSPVSVSRIRWASSIAISGVGGVPPLNHLAARKAATPARMNSRPPTTKKPQ